MKPNWTLIGRATLTALIFVNAGIGGLNLAPGIAAPLALGLGAVIAFLAIILPQPLAVLRRHFGTYSARLAIWQAEWRTK